MESELIITSVNLENISFHPDIKTMEKLDQELGMSYHLDIYRKAEMDRATKRKYDSLNIVVSFTWTDPETKVEYASVSVTTNFETKRMFLKDIDDMFLIVLFDIGIQHCAGWFAVKSMGTAMAHRVVKHPDHQEILDGIHKEELWD